MKINIENKEAIEKAIKHTETRCLSRTATYDALICCIEILEIKLLAIMSKCNWKGLKFVIDPGAPYNDLSRVILSTQFYVERGSREWFITGIVRGCCLPRIIKQLNLMEFKACILLHLEKNFGG